MPSKVASPAQTPLLENAKRPHGLKAGAPSDTSVQTKPAMNHGFQDIVGRATYSSRPHNCLDRLRTSLKGRTRRNHTATVSFEAGVPPILSGLHRPLLHRPWKKDLPNSKDFFAFHLSCGTTSTGFTAYETETRQRILPFHLTLTDTEPAPHFSPSINKY